MPAWPATLPQAPASWSEQARSNVVRTQPDSGPVKRRRRFTKAMKSARMDFLLTIEQRDTLKTFFETTLDDGLSSFTFTHPWSADSKTMWFAEPPTEAAEGALLVRVSCQVEFF